MEFAIKSPPVAQYVSAKDSERLLSYCEDRFADGTHEFASGDVECETGHFYRVNQCVVVTNSDGIHKLYPFASIGEAFTAIRYLVERYDAWVNDDE